MKGDGFMCGVVGGVYNWALRGVLVEGEGVILIWLGADMLNHYAHHWDSWGMSFSRQIHCSEVVQMDKRPEHILGFE